MKLFIQHIIIIGFLFPLYLKGQTQNEVNITRDIVYGHAGGVELKMDMGIPEGKGPFPLILFFHGGGWQQGDKSHMHKWIRKVVASGYAGVSVGYRFAPEYKWPSQVQDAKTAVRYLRAQARELNLDPSRFATMGESAGRYLALMVGMTSSKDKLEGEGGYSAFSSKVQAVVSYVSATDFTLPRAELSPELQAEMQQYYHKSLDQVRMDFTGVDNPDDPILKKISVLSYVDKGDPPVMMFYGDSDPIVSLAHAYALQRALEKVNVTNELFIVKGGGHGWTGPSQEETTQKMMAFFEKQLKGR